MFFFFLIQKLFPFLFMCKSWNDRLKRNKIDDHNINTWGNVMVKMEGDEKCDVKLLRPEWVTLIWKKRKDMPLLNMINLQFIYHLLQLTININIIFSHQKRNCLQFVSVAELTLLTSFEFEGRQLFRNW